MSIKTPVFDANSVRPSHRFLVCDEAKAEGQKMARNFRGYSSRKDMSWMKSQFGGIIRSIEEGGYPFIKRADEAMGGILVQSLQAIADGLKLPDYVLHYQTWAHDLADGQVANMTASARHMLTFFDGFRKSDDMADDHEDRLLERSVVTLSRFNARYEKKVNLDHLTPSQKDRLRKRIWLEAALEGCTPDMQARLWAEFRMTDEERAAREEKHRDERVRQFAIHTVKSVLPFLEDRFGVEFPDGFLQIVLKDPSSAAAQIKEEFARLVPGVRVNTRLIRIGCTDDSLIFS